MKVKAGIYKITNKINGKCYVGCSKDIYARWRDHKWVANGNSDKKKKMRLYEAMNKYGNDNFEIEIIEIIPVEDKELRYERERYWIEHFDSINNGYNTARGGRSYNLTRENHSQAKLTEKEAMEIKDLLKNTNVSYDEICDKYNITRSNITQINKGKNWHDKKLKYPLRDRLDYTLRRSTSCHYTDEEVLEIREMGKTMGCVEIAKKLGGDNYSTISNILLGKTYKRLLPKE